MLALGRKAVRCVCGRFICLWVLVRQCVCKRCCCALVQGLIYDLLQAASEDDCQVVETEEPTQEPMLIESQVLIASSFHLLPQ